MYKHLPACTQLEFSTLNGSGHVGNGVFPMDLLQTEFLRDMPMDQFNLDLIEILE